MLKPHNDKTNDADIATTGAIAALFDVSSDPMVLVDEEGTILRVNDAAAQALAPVPSSITDTLPNWRNLSSKGVELVQDLPNGVQVGVVMKSATVETDDGVRTIISWRDVVAEPMRIQEAGEAHMDALTGLLNREGLFAALSERPVQEIPMVAIHIDVEELQEVNHQHGYERGDEVVRVMASRAIKSAPASSLVGRTNGDEFVVIFDGSQEEGRNAARRIAEALKAPVVMPAGMRVAVTARIGWAVSGQSAEERGQVLSHATLALQEAKGSGQSVKEFDAATAVQVSKRRGFEEELRLAVLEGQFVLHAQPIVDIFERRVAGVEMLVRWQHPSGELRAPAEFIPVAERIGLIDEIDRWVLRATCEHAKSLSSHQFCSLNLSSHFISRPEASRYVIETLANSGLAAGRVLIEIKEGDPSVDAEALRAQAAFLHENGVAVALDNFGTGYSSLTSLMQMQVSTIKIGRSLVGLVSDTDGRSVVGAITRFADERKLRVIAEGVETAEDAEALRAIGCRYQQGYFHQRPGPVGDILRNLSSAADAIDQHQLVGARQASTHSATV